MEEKNPVWGSHMGQFSVLWQARNKCRYTTFTHGWHWKLGGGESFQLQGVNPKLCHELGVAGDMVWHKDKHRLLGSGERSGWLDTDLKALDQRQRGLGRWMWIDSRQWVQGDLHHCPPSLFICRGGPKQHIEVVSARPCPVHPGACTTGPWTEQSGSSLSPRLMHLLQMLLDAWAEHILQTNADQCWPQLQTNAEPAMRPVLEQREYDFWW